MKFFSRAAASVQGRSTTAEWTQRHSSGWSQILKRLKSEEGLRVLDFGPTSSSNINFLTNLGHSIYMADLVGSVDDARWTEQEDMFEAASFNVPRFLDENLNFGDRLFDVVLLWDTLAYLPEPVMTAMVGRLKDATTLGAQILGLFQAKQEGEFSRFHLKDGDELDVQPLGGHAVKKAYTTRQVEQMFAAYANCRFFLAKDNIREVLITR